MSHEYKKYLNKIKKNKILILVSQALIFIVFLLVWQFLSSKKIINPFLFSSPKKVFDTLLNIDEIFMHIGVTLIETIISFVLSTILGILISTLFWFKKTVYKVMDFYITTLNSLPKVALGPLILIIGGTNIKSIIIMALLISIFITITNITRSFNSTEENKIKLLKSMGASKLQIFKYLILPGSYKAIISTLRINISMTLIGVIMGEFLVSKKGIGYLIIYGSQTFNLSLVITGIMILVVISSILYYSVNIIEKKLT